MKLKVKPLEKIINKMLDEAKEGTHTSSTDTVVIHEESGAQVQVRVTNDELMRMGSIYVPYAEAEETAGGITRAHIEQLISEYELKISNSDILLDNVALNITRYRRSNDPRLADCRRDRAIWNAQRQAYIQARFDIEALLDHLGDA